MYYYFGRCISLKFVSTDLVSILRYNIQIHTVWDDCNNMLVGRNILTLTANIILCVITSLYMGCQFLTFGKIYGRFINFCSRNGLKFQEIMFKYVRWKHFREIFLNNVHKCVENVRNARCLIHQTWQANVIMLWAMMKIVHLISQVLAWYGSRYTSVLDTWWVTNSNNIALIVFTQP